MEEWLITCFRWIIIEGWVVLGYAILCHLALYKVAKKRNTNNLSQLQIYLIAAGAVGIWLMDSLWPDEPHAGILIAQFYYIYTLLAPFRYIAPFRYKIWNVIRCILQVVSVLPLVVLLAYYDVMHFDLSRLIDLILIVVFCGVMFFLLYVLNADAPCPACRRYTEQDDRNEREARGELFDKAGDIVRCPYCGQIYNIKTGELYDLVENDERAVTND